MSEIDREIRQCAVWCHRISLTAQILLFPLAFVLTSVLVNAIPQPRKFGHGAGLSLTFAALFLIPLVDACLSVILTTVIWKINRHHHDFINQAGKEAINMLLSIILYLFVIDTITLANCGFPYFPNPRDGVGIAYLTTIFNVFLILIVVINIKKAIKVVSNSQSYYYPSIIRFIS